MPRIVCRSLIFSNYTVLSRQMNKKNHCKYKHEKLRNYICKNQNVTVFIPAYNCQRTIGETLRSVSIQSYQYFNVLIIQDGENEDVRNVICNAVNEIDWMCGNIELVTIKENIGVMKIRGMVSNYVTTKFIAPIDSDDIWHPDYLSNIVRVANIDHGNYKIFYGRSVSFKDRSVIRLMGSRASVGWPDVLFNNGIGTPSATLINTEIYRNPSLRHTHNIRPLEDWVWYCDLLSNGIKAVHCKDAICYYRINDNSMTGRTTASTIVDSAYKMLDRYSMSTDENKEKIRIKVLCMWNARLEKVSIRFVLVLVLYVFKSKDLLCLVKLLYFLTPEFLKNLINKIDLKIYQVRAGVTINNSHLL